MLGMSEKKSNAALCLFLSGKAARIMTSVFLSASHMLQSVSVSCSKFSSGCDNSTYIQTWEEDKEQLVFCVWACLVVHPDDKCCARFNFHPMPPPSLTVTLLS